MFVIVIVIVIVGVMAGRASAQVAGTVVGDGGGAVSGARVELWSPTTRVAEQVTGGDGKFRFVLTESGSAVAILVRRIGFAPLRVPFRAGTADIVLRMRALPQMLADVTVTAARERCPNSPTDSARAAWRRLQERYESGVDLSRGTTMSSFHGIVPKRSIGDPDRTRLLRGDRAMSATGIAYSRLEIARFGYAWPSPAVSLDPDYGIWTYPLLDADYAQHFIETMFGERHTFSLLRGTDDERLLVFCPRDGKKSGLAGVLRIAPDGSPVSARWRFYNPDGEAEDAGGEVAFAPRDDRSVYPILLAASGVFWRRLKNGDYYERWEEFDAWRVEPGDSMLTKRQ